MASAVTNYKVVFNGQTTGEFDIPTSKARFGKTFNVAGDRLDKLFSGKRFTIKRDITREEALKYALRINQAGCDCVIERVFARHEAPNDNKAANSLLGDNLAGSPNFVERRRGERRTRVRRAARPRAITPDHRSGLDRRQS